VDTQGGYPRAAPGTARATARNRRQSPASAPPQPEPTAHGGRTRGRCGSSPWAQAWPQSRTAQQGGKAVRRSREAKSTAQQGGKVYGGGGVAIDPAANVVIVLGNGHLTGLVDQGRIGDRTILTVLRSSGHLREERRPLSRDAQAAGELGCHQPKAFQVVERRPSLPLPAGPLLPLPAGPLRPLPPVPRS
jgi:hypothetical protein